MTQSVEAGYTYFEKSTDYVTDFSNDEEIVQYCFTQDLDRVAIGCKITYNGGIVDERWIGSISLEAFNALVSKWQQLD